MIGDRRFFSGMEGFAGAEAALLACLLGAACIVVGLQLSQGAATAADHVDGEIATGSPDRQGGARPPLAWKVPVGSIPLALRATPPISSVQKNDWTQDRQLVVASLKEDDADQVDRTHIRQIKAEVRKPGELQKTRAEVRKPGEQQRLPVNIAADAQVSRLALTTNDSMRPATPAADKPLPDLSELRNKGYLIYPIDPDRNDAVRVLNSAADPKDNLRQQKIGKDGFDLVVNGTFSFDRDDKPAQPAQPAKDGKPAKPAKPAVPGCYHCIPAGAVVRNGHLDTPGGEKSTGRAGVAILDDGTLVLGRQEGSQASDIQGRFGTDDHKVSGFVGGGALLLENGKAVSSEDLATRQRFDQGHGGLNAQQLGKSSHTVFAIKDGQAFILIAPHMTGAQIQKDLKDAHFGSAVKFDGGSGSYLQDGPRPRFNGTDPVGFGVHLRKR